MTECQFYDGDGEFSYLDPFGQLPSDLEIVRITGDFPPGLIITVDTDEIYAFISGTPTKAGTYRFNIDYKITYKAQDTKTVTVTVKVTK